MPFTGSMTTSSPGTAQETGPSSAGHAPCNAHLTDSPALLGCSTLRRGAAQLLQQVVELLGVPELDDLPITDAYDIDAGHRDRPTGGRHTEELPGVGAGHGEPAHHLVSLGDEVLHLFLHVGEAGSPHLQEVPEAGPPRRRARQRLMVD